MSIHGAVPLLELADDERDRMMYGGVTLEREELGDPYRARRTDAREVVAHQVDNHQVLGAIFRALGKRLTQRRVVLRADAARPRALDRTCLDKAAASHV